MVEDLLQLQYFKQIGLSIASVNKVWHLASPLQSSRNLFYWCRTPVRQTVIFGGRISICRTEGIFVVRILFSLLRFTGHLSDILKVFEGQNEKIPVLSGSPALFTKTALVRSCGYPSVCQKLWKYSSYSSRGLGGSVGYTVWLEIRRLHVQPPPRLATFFRGDWSWNIFYGHSLPSSDSRRAILSFWRKYMHNTG